jgi:hypothetical protein
VARQGSNGGGGGGGTADNIMRQKEELVEMNKKFLREMIAPVNQQIEEIKRLYEEAKRASVQLSAAAAQGNSIEQGTA